MAAAAAAGARRLVIRASAQGLSDRPATLVRRPDYLVSSSLGFLGVLGNGGGVPGQIRNFTSCGGGGGGVLTGFLTGRSSDIAVFQFKKMMSTSTIPEKQGGVSVMSTSTVSEKQGGGCVELDSTKNKDREIEAIVSKIISREYRQRMDAMDQRTGRSICTFYTCW
uniref:Uncharacterized protein n=2 Tax=Oryza barthii TaxID=65489 RepID=A0A0D3GLB9_9ORYZ